MMKSPTPHLNCPSCHTPVVLDRYDRACTVANTYLVCPECDYTFLFEGVLDGTLSRISEPS
ncbi:hypothetical protein [Thauera sp. SDU_THAU2]|uniref:hypothetical protein n=1 Tax=Thauera sp. SDU_THAU2 TaxID=3136633 RepID=UPI0031204048